MQLTDNEGAQKYLWIADFDSENGPYSLEIPAADIDEAHRRAVMRRENALDKLKSVKIRRNADGNPVIWPAIA